MLVRVANQHLVILAVAVVLIGACGSSGDHDPATGRVPNPGIVRASNSEFQQAILDDGLVEAGEMESAVNAYVECVRQLGLDTEAQWHEDLQGYSYTYRAATAEQGEALQPLTADCRVEYLSDVELVWADQTGRTAEEDRAFYDGIAGCLRDRGLDAPNSDPDSLSLWVEQEPDLYEECWDEAHLATFGQ